MSVGEFRDAKVKQEMRGTHTRANGHLCGQELTGIQISVNGVTIWQFHVGSRRVSYCPACGSPLRRNNFITLPEPQHVVEESYESA